MAYVALTVRGGTEQEHDRIREALTFCFADGWGEVDVELTLDGPDWRIDKALIKPPGEIPWSCRHLVQRALNDAVETDRDVHIW
jgi:hypothetical protein